MAGVVEKPRTVRDLGEVDVSRLIPALQGLPDAMWNVEDARKENAFACFHSTRHITLRFVFADADPADYHTNPLWPVWEKLLMPVMEQAIRPYGFHAPLFPKAMFARLAAGGEISRHRDKAATNLRTHKIHVPLISNPLALFETGGEDSHLDVGRAYEVNNIVPHAARNGGDADRIHFIFEVFDGA